MQDRFINRLRRDVPLAPFTSFRIGGPARYYFSPRNIKDFSKALAWALRERVPYFILGGGSNVLIHDSGYNGLVIHTHRLATMRTEGNVIECECGVLIDSLVDLSLECNLGGLEFAAGLPGTVGGALFMNARAYGGAFSDITDSVTALKVEETGVREILLQREGFRFFYKRSVFQEDTLYVYSACFSLLPRERMRISNDIQKNRLSRQEKGQYMFPNVGCIFKNDYRIGVPTGIIVEELGLKGKRIGDAEVYEKHANFIVNRGNATAQDVYRLIRLIESEVKTKRNIELELEIKLIGEWPEAEKKSGRKEVEID